MSRTTFFTIACLMVMGAYPCLASPLEESRVEYAGETRCESGGWPLPNEAEAIRLHRKTAAQGDAPAQYTLGLAYELGCPGFQKNIMEAVYWHTLAARQGHAMAQVRLGHLYARGGDPWGKGMPKNQEEAVSWFRLAAEQGNRAGQFNLGVMYANGRGIRQDNILAYMWLDLAATRGLSEAITFRELFLMAKMPPDHIAEARRLAQGWKPKVADQLSHARPSHGAPMQARGPSLPEGTAESAQDLRLRAEKGDANAQALLGVFYLAGVQIRKDNAEAVRWFRKAAEQGVATAQCNLGKMYYEGTGIDKDLAEAAKWFRLAADKGVPDAQFALGIMYGKGEGVQKDSVFAYMWFTVAAANGMGHPARANAEKCALKMTSSQIALAKQMAAGWKPKAEK